VETTPKIMVHNWLRKEAGHWRITQGGAGLSESLIGLALSED